MDIRIKEPLYINQQGKEYVVRPSTVGVEKNHIVFFHDTTKANAVGFAKDFCIDSPQLFSISRTLTDKDVSVRDVLKIIDENVSDKETLERIKMEIKSL